MVEGLASWAVPGWIERWLNEIKIKVRRNLSLSLLIPHLDWSRLDTRQTTAEGALLSMAPPLTGTAALNVASAFGAFIAVYWNPLVGTIVTLASLVITYLDKRRRDQSKSGRVPEVRTLFSYPTWQPTHSLVPALSARTRRRTLVAHSSPTATSSLLPSVIATVVFSAENFSKSSTSQQAWLLRNMHRVLV